MLALVHIAPFEFQLRSLPDPVPAPDEVLIRVHSVGICGSDVHGMTGNTGRRIPPVIMGHEAAGQVISTGESVDQAWRGKRVTFDSTISCGSCSYCNSGLVNLCDNRMVLGVSCDEYRRDGALAEFVTVPERVLYELPDAVSYDEGAMVEPLSVAVHAVARARGARRECALVVGCGVIGLLTIQAAKAAGVQTVFATDLSERRRQVALEIGADRAVSPDQVENLGEVDLAFDAVGVKQTVGSTIAHVRKGGTVVLIGNVAASADFPLQNVVTRQLSVLGACASSGEYPECLQLISSGAVDIRSLITDTIPLEGAASMFGELHANPHDHLKAIVRPAT